MLITGTGVNDVVFSGSFKSENVEPRCQNSSGQTIATLSLGLWTGVIICGRLIAYLLKLTTLKRRAMKTNETDLVRCTCKEIGRIPMLTREQENLYGKRVQ